MQKTAPILASTVIFVVEENDGLKILLVKRSENLNFAANHFAFPGGKIEPFEINAANNEIILAAKYAAIRETFEEIGILLSRENTENKMALFDEIRIRKEISKEPELFNQKLNEAKQAFDFNKLLPLSRWQPPNEFMPKFDTYFFIYKLKQECELIIDDGELSQAIWISPQMAFENYLNGTMKFVFPTISTISLLAKFNKFAQIENFIKWKTPNLIKGKIIVDNEKTYQIIDQELGYPLYRMEFLS